MFFLLLSKQTLPLFRNYAECESRDDRVNDRRLSNFDLFVANDTQNTPILRMIEFKAKPIQCLRMSVILPGLPKCTMVSDNDISSYIKTKKKLDRKYSIISLFEN